MRFYHSLFPFLCLILGYAAAAWWWHIPPVRVPELRGLSLRAALCVAHEAGFAVDCQELSYAGEQLVMQQSPSAGTLVKRRRAITISIPLQQAVARIPACAGLRRVDAEKLLADAHVTHVEWLVVPSDLPEGLVLMHDPAVGVASEHILCVVAGTRDTRWCMPRFVGMKHADVQHCVERYGISLDCGGVISCDECTIEKQWPEPGAVIDRRRLTHVFCTLRCRQRH